MDGYKVKFKKGEAEKIILLQSERKMAETETPPNHRYTLNIEDIKRALKQWISLQLCGYEYTGVLLFIHALLEFSSSPKVQQDLNLWKASVVSHLEAHLNPLILLERPWPLWCCYFFSHKFCTWPDFCYFCGQIWGKQVIFLPRIKK